MSKPARQPLAALGASTGFRSDVRFSAAEPVPPPPEPEPEPKPKAEDPITLAYAEGFAAGASEARGEAVEKERFEEQARERLALSFARLDREMAQELEVRLRQTVVALCESALSPLVLDEASLLPRIKRAVAMLARTEDEPVIRLHPNDLAFVAPQLSQDWRVQPDASLPRGSIRIEGANGGVEDGPEQWSREIHEALGRC